MARCGARWSWPGSRRRSRGAAAGAWADVFRPLAETTRVCRHDRPGLRSSPPVDGPRTSAAMAGELRALLAAAAVDPPYVLVGTSFGGLSAQLFARSHPDEVAGVMLVDALHPDFDRRFADVMGHRAARERARVGVWAAAVQNVEIRRLCSGSLDVCTAWVQNVDPRRRRGEPLDVLHPPRPGPSLDAKR